MPSQKKILEVKNLKKYFPTTQKQQLKAVDNVSFDIYEGETLGIVGESGCGENNLRKNLSWNVSGNRWRGSVSREEHSYHVKERTVCIYKTCANDFSRSVCFS